MRQLEWNFSVKIWIITTMITMANTQPLKTTQHLTLLEAVY